MMTQTVRGQAIECGGALTLKQGKRVMGLARMDLIYLGTNNSLSGFNFSA